MKGLCLLTSQLFFFYDIFKNEKSYEHFKSVNMGIFMGIYRAILCMKRVATTDPKLFHFLIQMLITFLFFKAIVTKLGSIILLSYSYSSVESIVLHQTDSHFMLPL